MPAGRLEPCTESNCEQCGGDFVPKNRNGIKVRFCKPACSTTWHNARRLKAAAALNHKKPKNPRGPSRHARQVSQTVFLGLVPIEERAELLRQAATSLGITDEDRIQAALRRAEVPDYEGAA